MRRRRIDCERSPGASNPDRYECSTLGAWTSNVDGVSEIANVDAAAAWEKEGVHWTTHAERYDHNIRRFHARLMDGAAIQRAERVLDIGCGTGQTTRDAAHRASDGSALGLDIAQIMIDHAREITEAQGGPPNVRFERGDAQVYRFEPDSIDVVISRLGAMFFTDPVPAFSNIASGMSSGGRLALMSWAPLERQEWILKAREALAMGRDLPKPPPGAPGPFAHAGAGDVRDLLARAGFTDIRLDLMEDTMFFGTETSDAFDFFKGAGFAIGMMEDLNEADRTQALENARRMMEQAETPEGVGFDAAAWLIHATRS